MTEGKSDLWRSPPTSSLIKADQLQKASWDIAQVIFLIFSCTETTQPLWATHVSVLQHAPTQTYIPILMQKCGFFSFLIICDSQLTYFASYHLFFPQPKTVQLSLLMPLVIPLHR